MKETKLKIAIYTNDLNSGCHYYRAEVPSKYLRKLGHTVDIKTEFPIVNTDDGPKILSDEIDKYNLLLFQRSYKENPYYLTSILNYAKKNDIAVSYDLDDNVTDIPSWNPASSVFLNYSMQKLINFFITNSDKMTVASPALQEQYKVVKPALLRNSLDFEIWDKANDKDRIKRDIPTIGFAGGASHFRDLQMVKKTIKRLVKEKKAKFVCMGIDPKFDFDYEFYEWNPKCTRYPFQLAKLGIDIGIAPLLHDKFNQYKSNLKWLEYSAINIATIASYEKPYYEIKHGINGMLCEKEEDWYENLTELINNKKLKTYISNNAYKYVYKHYDASKYVKKWEKLYIKLINNK